MSDWSPLEDDVLLKGLLTVIVHRRDGSPCRRQRISVRACGFI